MIMSWIWVGMLGVSFLSAVLTHSTSALSAAIPQGAASGVQLAVSMAGSICLWTGVGKLMEHAGITGLLSKLLHPALIRLFPPAKENPELKNCLSTNICANILGLGNAATPMGIRAAQLMAKGQNGIASDALCRLIVLNTASIQLIPATVAAVRASLGCTSPFDILPAVWITSLASASVGIACAWLMGKVWHL